MNVEVNNSVGKVKLVKSFDFNGIFEFNMDENGNLIDADKTKTYQEIYDMVKPVVEIEEETEAEEIEDEQPAEDGYYD